MTARAVPGPPGVARALAGPALLAALRTYAGTRAQAAGCRWPARWWQSPGVALLSLA